MQAIAAPDVQAPGAQNAGEPRLRVGRQLALAASVARPLTLAVVYAAPPCLALHAAHVGDLDLWWHLRGGEWIMQHHAIPHTDAFSSTEAGQPWAAYSWLFEIIVSLLFRHLGLPGILVYTAGMVLLITVAVHHLLEAFSPRFAASAVLTFAACFSMAQLYTPRPWLFSILLFTLELDLLLRARSTGRWAPLLWLLPLFALWANLHIQFVDGLLVLVLAAMEAVAGLRWPRLVTGRLPLRWAAGVLLGCLLAVCVNPYGWHIYKVAYALAAEPAVMNMLAELEAMPFRALPDYCVLALGLLAAAALARRAQPPVFEAALLVFAAVVSFRSQRDMWVMAIVGAALIASSAALPGTPHAAESAAARSRRPQPLLAALACAAAVCFLLLAAHALRITKEGLAAGVAEDLPVHAVQAIQAHGYRGPLFNDYDWGGYLTWTLRQPVVIDGRAALYGDKRLERSRATWNGAPDWRSDPDLAAAALVVGPLKAPLVQLLRMDGRYRVVYEDKLAAVFVRQAPSLTERVAVEPPR